MPSATAVPAPAAAAPLPLPEEDFVWHVVTPRDTLMGLSLVYKTPANAILQANDLPSSGNLALLPRVKIPRGQRLPPAADAEASQRAKVREFRARNGLPEAEAKYYLMEAGWDLERAQEVLAGHVAFERRVGGFDAGSAQVVRLPPAGGSERAAGGGAGSGGGAGGSSSGSGAGGSSSGSAGAVRGLGERGQREEVEEQEEEEEGGEGKPLVGGRGAGSLRRRKPEGGQ